MQKQIPTYRDPWARWAKIIFAIVVCATLLALAGCSKGGGFAPQQGYDQCLRREIMKECMAALPAGPVSTKYNDWDEVVAECGTQAGRLSWRKLENVKAECQ